MIVLDENLNHHVVRDPIARWYRGAVINIKDLRPATIIKDDVVATLLRRVSQPTFVTINYSDFWKVIPASGAHCVVCIKLPQERKHEVPGILRDILSLPEFRTKRARMGCVISVRESAIDSYRV